MHAKGQHRIHILPSPACRARLKPRTGENETGPDLVLIHSNGAAVGRMPPAVACKFTQGEQAALAVIAVEVTKRNTCSIAIGAIAALAGVSKSTVKRPIRQARALGFMTV